MGKFLHSAKTALHRNSPAHIIREQQTRHIIKQFADKIGFVYFGFVNQRDDEHRLLRGITLSRTHRDNHYTVGTYETYDTALVIRRDTLEYPDTRLKDHFWTIMTFDLHTTIDVPPFYLTHQRAKQQLLARYTQLIPLITGTQAMGSDFTTTYTIYASMAHAQEIQLLFNEQISAEIVKRFKDISIELTENTIYLYAPEKHPSRQQLEKMLSNGLWLANIIDSAMANSYYQ